MQMRQTTEAVVCCLLSHLSFIFFSKMTLILEHKNHFQLQITASVHERPLRTTLALLLWPTWLAAAILESTLLFVTERGFSEVVIYF